MDQLPAYRGDASFQELLARIGSSLSIAEVRSRIMRDIWAIDTVQPTATLDAVLGAKPAEVFSDAEVAKDFMLQFLALWSSLIPHLEEAHPFRLYPYEGSSAEELRFRHSMRVTEIKILLGLFDFDKASHPELAQLIQPSEAILKQVLATLDVEVPAAETDTPEAAAQFAEALGSIEQAVETLFHQVGGRIVHDRQQRINQRESHRQFLAKHKEVGRNDPCPCGSGKKFKKCCMGGPFLALIES